MFSWTPLRWLGNMSYSYYLIHGLALKAGFLALAVVIAKQATHGWGWFWLMLPLMFALSIVPSAMLFLFVERPFSLAGPRTSSKAKESSVVQVASETTIP
jgi:peptidoglycan/LPS O-acetylase OafA/YrhL